MNYITGLLKEIWHTFNEAAFYVLFGLFIAGLIQIFVNKDKIVKHLGDRSLKSVLLAALFGVPLPLCSCGVLPMAVSLRKNGASRGAALSFLISTPETGVDSIAISYALLDPIMTIFRPIAAFITAVIAGIVENIFGKKDKEETRQKINTCESCGCNEDECNRKHSIVNRFKDCIRYAFRELLGDIAKWLIFGIVIAGIISYFVPVNLVERYLGNNMQAMLLMLVIGIPLYICATASTPIAAALIAKGMSPGVALVFLLVGPATNVAGIFAVGKFLGKRSLIIYLLSISVCAVTLGQILNYVYSVTNMDIRTTIGKAGEILPYYLKLTSALILAFLMIKAIYNFKNKKAPFEVKR